MLIAVHDSAEDRGAVHITVLIANMATGKVAICCTQDCVPVCSR